MVSGLIQTSVGPGGPRTAHPGREDLNGRVAVLAPGRAPHGAAEVPCHELHAVADAEDGDARAEPPGVEGGASAS